MDANTKFTQFCMTAFAVGLVVGLPIAGLVQNGWVQLPNPLEQLSK